MNNPKVVELKQTCSACPSQWEGKLDDGRGLYIRFRHGFLQVMAGEGNHLLDWPVIFSHTPDESDDMNGTMTFDELVGYTGGALDFTPIDPTPYRADVARQAFHWAGLAAGVEAAFYSYWTRTDEQYRTVITLEEAREAFNGGVHSLEYWDNLLKESPDESGDLST